MNPSLFLQSLALHLAWMEGKDNGTNGILAILFCLRNRIAAGWEDANLARIIQGASYGKSEAKKAIWWMEVPDTREPKFYDAMGYVESVFDNTAQDRLTEGALYWGDNPIGAKQKVAQVGTLNLWK